MTSRDSSSQTLLEFAAVSARFSDDAALFENLALAVRSGQIVALQGRSGSGKSTALSIAMGLRRPESGIVSWCGVDLYSLDEAGRAEVRRDHYGVVLQDGGLLNGLTALENVLVPVLRRRARVEDRDRALHALEMVGMAHRTSHSPGRLSGGEVQRVAFARALFADPELLIVDEPTASLDRRSADDIISLMAEVAADGRGVLVASHDVAVIDVAHDVHDIEWGGLASLADG